MEMTGNGRAWPDTSAASWSSSPLVFMMAPAIWLTFDGTTVDSLYYLYYQPSPLNPRTESPGCLYWEIYCTSDFSHNRSVEWTYQICVCLSHVLSLCDSDFCVRACVCVLVIGDRGVRAVVFPWNCDSNWKYQSFDLTQERSPTLNPRLPSDSPTQRHSEVYRGKPQRPVDSWGCRGTADEQPVIRVSIT